MNHTIKTVFAPKLHLGEGPIWDERLQLLYFVDIFERQLFMLSYQKQEPSIHTFDEYISCIALTERPATILIALESGLYCYDILLKTKKFLLQAEIKENYRYNDGSVDSSGNWLIGSMNNINNGENAPLLPDATLYRISKHNAEALLNQVTISNGIAFVDKHMYFIDSFKNNIQRFDYSTPQLGKPTVIYELTDGTTLDGMCASTSKKLYIANWGGAKILVFDLQLEQIVDEIEIPAKNPTSCTFGGPKLNDLYITTSSINDSNPSSSGVYVIPTDDTGFTENKINWD